MASVLRQEVGKTLHLAGPLILGEVAQVALSLIDSAMVGAISYKQLAAVALVTSVINIPFVFGIGITLSISQTVSMAHGKNDKALTSHYFYNGFWLCTIAAVIIALGIEFGKGILFHLKQDIEVAQLGLPYMGIVGWSMIPTMLFFALKQFTDGLQYTKVGMILSLAALPINVFLNWLLIFGKWGFPRLEIKGAALGTLYTRILVVVILALIVLRHPLFRRYIAVRKKQWFYNWQTQKELLHIGIPSSFQIAMEAGAFAVSGILVGMIDAVSLAAHQIALNMASFTFVISIGFASAASIRTSNAYGAGNWQKIYQIGKSTLLTALFYGVTCALLFILFRNQLPYIFNNNVAVVQLGALLLLFAAIFQTSDSIQANSAGLLRGIKDMKIPTFFIAVSYWIIALPLGILLAFYFRLGAVGIWIGLISGLTTSAIFLSLRFLRLSKKRIST